MGAAPGACEAAGRKYRIVGMGMVIGAGGSACRGSELRLAFMCRALRRG